MSPRAPATVPNPMRAISRRPPRPPRDSQMAIGRYYVVEHLGSGGMGVVRRAIPMGGGRPVAIKILAEHLDPADGWARFQREMDALESLRHPNIVSLLDRGWLGQRPYFVMELINGPDLPTLLKERGPLSRPAAMNILQQLASALASAHAQGLVHRDMKPSNVMLHRSPDGTERVKLLDFGLVLPRSAADAPRITAESLLLGTPGYVAPEGVASPWALDARSDVYGLAMVAFYLRTGKHLFEPKDVVDRNAHSIALQKGLARLRQCGGYDPELMHLLTRCLAYDPADRPPSEHSLFAILNA